MPRDVDVRMTPEEMAARRRFWFLFWFIGGCGIFACCLVGVAFLIRYGPPLSSGSSSGVTRANYHRLDMGMSYHQVAGILGADGEEMARAGDGPFEVATYTWKRAGGSNITVTFQGGRLASKAQFGL